MKTNSLPALALGTWDGNETPTREIALWRIYLLRAGYLLIAVGMGMQKIPAFLHHRPWELMHGVVNSMLLALVLLAVLGLRYPLKMLPLLFWEIAWKAKWLLAVALPALAEPHHRRRYLGHNFCLPDERDFPVRRAMGLCLAEFCRRAR